MSKLKRTDEVDFIKDYVPPVKNRLTPQQLYAFDVDLEKFRVTKVSNFFPDKKLTFINENAWLISVGALSRDGAVIVTDYKPPVYNESGRLVEAMDCKPIIFQQRSADLEQWRTWKARKAYGETKKLEQLAEMQSSMEIIAEDMKM